MSEKEKFKKKLLVEGNSDQRVVSELITILDIQLNFDFRISGGIDPLIAGIPVLLKRPDLYDTLGLIVDADTNVLARWQKIKTVFFNSGINLPKELPSSGLIYSQPDGIKIGVWIMPNNHLPGMLEDFITFLVPKDDELIPIVVTHLDNIEEKKLNKYNKEIHKSKALIHSWLAIQENPGTPLGRSITKKYLTTDSKTCSIFVNWLKELFKDE